ncbi:retinol dehydrogenase 12-like isoform X5 [Centruroides vittatus]|uniref:retinol dehydrogenase 12-like isoform X5 n=1 Tax=Centruroides vittatus TaxID=120091 RepID=UPI00350F52C1
MDIFRSLDFRNYFTNNPIQTTIIVLTAASVALLKKWLSGKSCHSFNRLDGKTVIITGGNTGIGKETAIDLSRRGLGATPFQKTQEGYEMQFGVNHLGHFLLTLLLLDRIKSSAPARIINVSSMAYKYGKIKFDDLNSEKDYKPIPAYCQSKLANIYFTRELAKRLEGTNVTTYCLHPGVVDTELGRYLKDSSGFHYTIAFYITSKLFFKSTKQGAQTTIYCAVAEELANESGHFYTECRRSRLNSNATDDTVAEKLWKISEEMTGITI